VERAKAGQVNYRVDSGRNLHAHIGKITFKDDQLLRNFKSLMQSLVEKKPTGIKGRYFQEAYIKSTMGPRWKLKIEEIDPRNLKTVWDLVN
jgi:large subunit ribosomal protein L1